MNPERMVYEENMQQLRRLKEENKALMEQLRSNGSRFMGSFSQFSSTSLLQKERMDLERRIQESDLRQQRLREVCARKIAEFRQACFILTGYRIDMHEDDIFR